MTSAQILRDPDEKLEKSIPEQPSLYSTVIQPRSTSIMHPQPQPMNIPTTRKNAFAFSSEGIPNSPDNKNMPNSSSSLHVPVKIQSEPIRNDPTLAGYETPEFEKQKPMIPNSSNEPSGNANEASFVQKKIKKEKTENGNESTSESGNQSQFMTEIQNKEMGEVVTDDIHKFISQLDNKKDRAEKIDVMIQGKNRLTSEAGQLQAVVRKEMEELMIAKKLALRLNNMMNKYLQKIEKDKTSHMKLADEITIKELLRDKLHREIQGFRIAPQEYAELEQINPNDIKRVVDQVQLKLGEQPNVLE